MKTFWVKELRFFFGSVYFQKFRPSMVIIKELWCHNILVNTVILIYHRIQGSRIRQREALCLESYGTPEGTFPFRYLAEKKSKQ